jgi:hypothetical protein
MGCPCALRASGGWLLLLFRGEVLLADDFMVLEGNDRRERAAHPHTRRLSRAYAQRGKWICGIMRAYVLPSRRSHRRFRIAFESSRNFSRLQDVLGLVRGLGARALLGNLSWSFSGRRSGSSREALSEGFRVGFCRR